MVPPAYDALVATSRRRRRGGVTVMSVATIVVIGTVWVGVRGTWLGRRSHAPCGQHDGADHAGTHVDPERRLDGVRSPGTTDG